MKKNKLPLREKYIVGIILCISTLFVSSNHSLLAQGFFGFKEHSASTSSVSERTLDPFYIQADFDLATIETELASLKALSEELTRVLNLPLIRERIIIQIFSSEDVWKAYYKAHFGDSLYRRALFDRKEYLLDRQGSGGRVYLCLNPLFINDMRHEGTHAIISASLKKSLPIWLDEGLAEYFEIAAADPIANETWFPKTCERLQTGEITPLTQLEKLTGMGEMSRSRYGDSWAWVCYLLNGPPAVRGILPQYLNDLGSRKLFLPSISKRLNALGIQPENEIRSFFYQRAAARPQ